MNKSYTILVFILSVFVISISTAQDEVFPFGPPDSPTDGDEVDDIGAPIDVFIYLMIVVGAFLGFLKFKSRA